MLTVIAIDDEPLALKLVEGYVKRTPVLQLAGLFDNALDAMDYLSEHPVDLVLTDIQMPDMKGTDFVRMLEKAPMIIFTTAYEKYAIEGFRLNAVDYLMKPFGYDEFLTAIRKAEHLVELERQSAYATAEAGGKFLFLKSEYKVRRVNFSDILYIEGLKDYIKVYVQHEEKPLLSLSSLKVLEQKLPSVSFMRVHRSFIVNLDKIETIDRLRIVFGDVYIPVGEQYKERFQEFVERNFL
ncbi:LytTR family two component transcriptional regulator [Breznakibacter xylanolyticus]|uniref:LytTR family two component transcriptional regulator n=1 Tax=Breznakibacter xylanolyticus TaxID=990 RepID=A0A2W7P036_9BACT|nr:LytTR family DNA-binding domain-containing protein [Breznakibacter xylanolyticus]PZX16812.1 LytTR family two component transcriptional regulator [Breznakibacter xylanolyticus]